MNPGVLSAHSSILRRTSHPSQTAVSGTLYTPGEHTLLSAILAYNT